ncbi:hypothetical protein [Legionella sp. km772]|uniref:hypothetical protein n=1 Tax=Legionella sp. km772 TaxID=2498111 RepID=UPI000F8DE643|nr:hypothetical protein [Legionella sp. km772]RUR08376.1 hypothetical protein ELY15_11060 [Legionella sp. km772]
MITKQDISTRKEAIARIKPVLQGTMLKKLNPSALWSYVATIPPNQTFEQVSQNIHSFAVNKVDGLIALCDRVLPYYTYDDMVSIGTRKPTQNAKKFMKIFAYLIVNGFPGPYEFGDSSFNFWSGKAGKERAYSSPDAISDSNIPAIAAMYDISRSIRLLQGKHDDFINLLISSISRLYASYTVGVAHVYISSDKESEAAGFVANNNFWNSELPTLRHLLAQKLITDIQIHTYDHHLGQWNKSFSINSPQALKLPVRRRSIHPSDDPLHADRYQTFFMSDAANSAWSKSLPRPEISYGALLKICGTWRDKTQSHKLETTLNKSAMNALNVLII